MPKLCLCMIVKNEAPVIRRCLASVKPTIDAWVVVDTGSTDGTQDLVREALADLPGELVERPWVDFAHNRTEALAIARLRADYSLVIDADDVLELPSGFRLPELDADSYVVQVQFATIRYERTQVVRNALPWRYEGVLHEYLVCEEARSVGKLPLVMRPSNDGARRRDPNTYRKDAEILERALGSETKPGLLARYTFYLAQSYRDCGERGAAITAYLRRAEMGFWNQEVFVSLLQAGRLMEAAGRSPQEVLAIYERATATCPERVEARHAASRLLRHLGENRRGFEVARPGIGLDVPTGGLFVEPWIYRYGLLDEYAINAYWAGFYRECQDACLHILVLDDVPATDRSRIIANARFALTKLVASPP